MTHVRDKRASVVRRRIVPPDALAGFRASASTATGGEVLAWDSEAMKRPAEGES